MKMNTLIRLRSAIMAILLFCTALPTLGATITVTNLNDSGPGSLRAAIAAANPGDTIMFGVTGTITLISGVLEISKNLTISGPGPTSLAISGNNASSVFQIDAGVTASISGVGVESGLSGILNFGTMAVTNSTFSGNGNGGGIFNSGTATVTNSTFSGNSAVDGGGINNSGGTATVTNSTFSGNSATSGGGLFNSGTATVTNSTFSGNSATSGGGSIFGYSGVVTVKNTLLANAPSGGNCYNYNPVIGTAGHNLSDDTSCGFTGTGDMTVAAGGAGLDLNGLQNNGGLTQTIALLATSPAVEAIPLTPTNYCTDVNGALVSTDQRGVTRPQQGSACDIGAFELAADNDSQFSQLNGGNTFTGNQTVNGAVSAASFVGDGSGLTNVTAAGLNCRGCVGPAQLGIPWAAGDSSGGNALNALALGGRPPGAFQPAGSYATTGANLFSGDQNIAGNLTATGAVNGATANFTGALASTSANFSGPLSAVEAVLPSAGTATATQGFNSGALDVVASSFNSSTGGAWGELFRWQAEPTGNNTASPSATLNLLFGTDKGSGKGAKPLETGLSVNSDGTINFAAGQTFPGGGSGSGTITGVTAGSGITISGSPNNPLISNSGVLSVTGSGPISVGTANGTATVSCLTCNMSNATVSGVALSAPAGNVFTVTGSPVTTSGVLALNAAGNSGGIPYFDSSSSISSSGALVAGGLVLGGGAGAPPSTNPDFRIADGGGTAFLILGTDTSSNGFLDLEPSAKQGSEVQIFNAGRQGSAILQAGPGVNNSAGILSIPVAVNGTLAVSASAPLVLNGTTGNLSCPTCGTGFGTITGVTAGAGLLGGGSTGNVTLNLDLTKVPQLAAANTFSANQTVNGTVTATSFTGNGSQLTGVNAVNAQNLGGLPPASYAPATGSPNYVFKAGDSMTGDLQLPNLNASGSITASGIIKAGQSVIATGVSATSSLVVGGGTPITKHLSITFTGGFGPLKPSTCSALTFTFPGVSDGDTIALGVPNLMMAVGGIPNYFAWVSAANTITIRACNLDASNPQKTAPNGTFRVDIWKH